MFLKFYFKTICISFIVILLLTACSSNDESLSENTGESITPATSNLKIESTNTFCYLKLSADDYNYWNGNSINSIDATAKLKAFYKKEIYSNLKDDFDFVIIVMNNTDLPSLPAGGSMPYGEYQHVKNDIQGIGLELFDHTSEYGSTGKLQGVYFLYKNNIDLGPVLHEMCHRWANWAVPQNYGGHWDKVQGVLTGAGNSYADIELYLAGAIPASQIKDPESLTIYNDSRFTNKTRTPNSANSQKSFKSLVVVMSKTDLTDAEITAFKARIANITRIPSQGTTNPVYQNIYNKSNGLLTLSIGQLDASKK
ncbi:hypothetical protein [Flavobacterium granuli]|uniref:Substrate import-associated zinc metallohydrolase lipoprotein n=1 Tax=Flavobacterium granuli TaxID=280093 RepID=A0ABU1S248_9FLAO|nr:hypothetical protein [Flavobacterium granuli]MDR6844725.1 hypothetical protein [Flavobacterium granuli]